MLCIELFGKESCVKVAETPRLVTTKKLDSTKQNSVDQIINPHRTFQIFYLSSFITLQNVALPYKSASLKMSK